MVLANRGMGARIMQGVCFTDMAFERLEHVVARVANRPLWSLFREAVANLEGDLEKAGGPAEEVAAQIEYNGSYFGPAALLDRYFATEEILGAMDDTAGAFVLTLHARLTAVRDSAARVYEVATSEGLAIDKPALGTDMDPLWHLGNYVKHRDEWGDVLDFKQRKVFVALRALGVAEEVEGERSLHRWTVSEALKRLGNDALLSSAMHTVAVERIAASAAIAARVDRDFIPFKDDLLAARKEHRVRCT